MIDQRRSARDRLPLFECIAERSYQIGSVAIGVQQIGRPADNSRVLGRVSGRRGHYRVPIRARMYFLEMGIRMPDSVTAGQVRLFLLGRIRTALDHITEEPSGHSPDGHCR